MTRWKDWFEQGERDLQKSGLDLANGYYEWACFTAQQASEKIIKALGMKMGYALWGHSITEMLKTLSKDIDIPPEINEKAQMLDIYYIPSRYPNGFPQGKPADYFNQKKAEEAVNAGNSIITFAKGYLFE